MIPEKLKIGLISALFAIATSFAQQPTLLTEEQAREEARIVIEALKQDHPKLYWYTDDANFVKYEQELLGRKGPVSIEQHYFDLAKLFSMVTDTHTQIYPDYQTPGFSSVYPIRFQTFADGLYVLAADEPYESLIGQRVCSFGGQPADEVMDKLSNYVSADHTGRKKTLAEFLLIMPETYRVFGWAEGNRVELELEDASGSVRRGYLEEVHKKSFATAFYDEPDSFGTYVPDGWKTVYEVFSTKPALSRSKMRSKYWSTTLDMAEDKTALYIQINKNDNEAQGESQFDFVLRTFYELSKQDNKPDRIIIDLRYNLGGWIKNTAALSRLLYGSDYYRPGKVIVLIGRESVSAGTILAADIENSNYVYFIGEPSGSKPNMFLDHKQIELPYSKFYAESATDTYLTTTEKDRRHFLAPDLHINETFGAFVSGKDQALESALKVDVETVKSAQGGFYLGGLWRRPSQARDKKL